MSRNAYVFASLANRILNRLADFVQRVAVMRRRRNPYANYGQKCRGRHRYVHILVHYIPLHLQAMSGAK
jgi:hypothetical protein